VKLAISIHDTPKCITEGQMGPYDNFKFLDTPEKDPAATREALYANIQLLDPPGEVPALDHIRLLDSPEVAVPSQLFLPHLLDSPSHFLHTPTPKKRRPKTSQKPKSSPKRTNFTGSISSVNNYAETAGSVSQYSAFNDGGFDVDNGGGFDVDNGGGFDVDNDGGFGVDNGSDFASPVASQLRRDVVDWNVDLGQLKQTRQLELPKYWAELTATPAGIVHLTANLFALLDWNPKFSYLKVFDAYEKSLK
jgi:hypothetical protein